MKYPSELHQIVSESPRLAPLTKRSYITAINRWIAFAGPDPAGWNRNVAHRFYLQLINSGISVRSANTMMNSLKYAAKWWADRSPGARIDFTHIELAPNSPSTPREALDPTQALAILDTTLVGTPIDIRDRALLVVALETGMRSMSLAGMSWDGLKSNYPRCSVPLKGKGEVPYDVPLSDAAMLALGHWRAWLAKHKVKGGDVWRRLLPGIDQKGLRAYEISDVGISQQAIYKMVVSRAERAGSGHVHPHIFRHTYVTWRTELGMPLEQIISMTGHSPSHSLGSAGGYMDRGRLGAIARQVTPEWLANWCQTNCR